MDASEYAERYRREAEQLNDLERRNRTEGEAFDDFSVARISSFLKSYGEMRKGEQFVMGEVRARARERVRWGASLGLLAFALLFAPVSLAAPVGASTALGPRRKHSVPVLHARHGAIAAGRTRLCAPMLSTVKSTSTLPAFSNASVALTCSPCASGFLRPTNIT